MQPTDAYHFGWQHNMEFVSGISIRQILLDNNNWWKFFLLYAPLIRYGIIINVIKVLVCRTKMLGCHSWLCRCCGLLKCVNHTCKSRFCSSCGKKATDQWVNRNLADLPSAPWQHITFTLPSEFWPLFWLNRHLTNLIAPLPAQIMTELAKQKNMIPGIFMAIHTFGRDLKRNVHFHLSITLEGMSLDQTQWNNHRAYFHHEPIKKMWRYRVLAILRKEYEAGRLILPNALNCIKTASAFSSWLHPIRQKSWVVHLSKPCTNHHRNIKYIGRYLKRPPISEANIIDYNGVTVTYRYRDHQKKTQRTFTLPVLDFIKRLIAHIPDLHFRMIRYYNWLSNRTRSRYLPLVYRHFNQTSYKDLEKRGVSWRNLHIQTFGIDPLLCPHCKIEFVLVGISWGFSILQCLKQHKNIAMGEMC